MELDHLVVTGTNLDAAADHTVDALGVDLQPGGQHAKYSTHNRLLGFRGREYLEAIATDPSVEPPECARWFGLDTFTGRPKLATWVARVADIDEALKVFPDAGEVFDLEPGALAWRIAVPASGALHFGGVIPLLIQWKGDVHPSDNMVDKGCRIEGLRLGHPDNDRIAGLLRDLGLNDGRVEVVKADAPTLSASISTPEGVKDLR